VRKMLPFGVLLALFAGLVAGPASAENWPARGVTMIVPFPRADLRHPCPRGCPGTVR